VSDKITIELEPEELEWLTGNTDSAECSHGARAKGKLRDAMDEVERRRAKLRLETPWTAHQWRKSQDGCVSEGAKERGDWYVNAANGLVVTGAFFNERQARRMATANEWAEAAEAWDRADRARDTMDDRVKTAEYNALAEDWCEAILEAQAATAKARAKEQGNG
jgi:hypothetical protein